MKKVIIYTDGACSGNPGNGGWGAVLIYNNNVKQLSGYQVATTNNRMELKAVINALKQLKEPCEVEINLDSSYVVNAINNNWLRKWSSNGWINSSKQDVKNKDLWEELLELIEIHTLIFVKVKGHSGDKYNQICDDLATQEIKAHKTDL
ncbi:MAG: ribonuclease HI [Clostridia bacterium]